MILIENISSRLKLTEGAVNDGSLATLSGVFAEYDKKNLNGRVYSEKLWDKVLESEDLQRQLNGRILFGELDHPIDRLEPVTEKAAFAITELHKDPATKTIQGTAKVLDTPAGKILNTLLRFGSVLGMSSRGSGDIIGEEVDPDSYDFVTFDVVTNPSNVGAHPSLQESKENQEKVVKALIESTQNADDKGLKLIEEVSTTFDEETSQTIINKVEERKVALAEDDHEDDAKEDPKEEAPKAENDQADDNKILQKLDLIAEKLDILIEIMGRAVAPAEPEQPDAGLVDAEVKERVAVKVVAKKRTINENTGDPVKRVVESVIEGSTQASDVQRVAKIVAAGKK